MSPLSFLKSHTNALDSRLCDTRLSPPSYGRLRRWRRLTAHNPRRSVYHYSVFASICPFVMDCVESLQCYQSLKSATYNLVLFLSINPWNHYCSDSDYLGDRLLILTRDDSGWFAAGVKLEIFYGEGVICLGQGGQGLPTSCPTWISE